MGGHVKYQFTHTDYRAADINAVFGENPAQDHNVDIRLKAERRAGPWDLAVHYEVLGITGDSLETRRNLAAAGFGFPVRGTVSGLPDDRRQLFDLTDDLTDRERRAAVQRLDRLAIGHSTPRLVVRFGRQAVSWGNGLVFHPLDFVNPFSPIAIDKDYKTGDDMLYAQWVTGSQSDLQAIVLPRRDPATHDVESDQSTVAAKHRLRLEGVDVDVLVARHFDEGLVGVGTVRSIGGAVWRLDVSFTDLESGGSATSLVTNMDYSWIWGGRNVYGFVEYFHNGVGESDTANYASPNPELAERIERGELFTLARDYVGLGLQIELTPLFNLFSNLIWNLDDGSIFFQIRGVYDWTQNLQLMGGVNLPSGDRGDEYGGIPVPGSNTFLTPGRSIYVRLAYYF